MQYSGFTWFVLPNPLPERIVKIAACEFLPITWYGYKKMCHWDTQCVELLYMYLGS